MYNNYASMHAFWSDTTNMDNLRGGDATGQATPGAQEVTSEKGDVSGFGNTVHSYSGDTFYSTMCRISWPKEVHITNARVQQCKSFAENYCTVACVTWGHADGKVTRPFW
jgi:hypothetical protein